MQFIACNDPEDINNYIPSMEFKRSHMDLIVFCTPEHLLYKSPCSTNFVYVENLQTRQLPIIIILQGTSILV